MKMNERLLSRISIIGTVICLIALYVLTSQINSVHVNIGDIKKDYVGKNVNITGTVTGLKRSQGHLFFDLKDETGSVKVVLWNNSLEFLEMKNISMSHVKDGDLVNMIGNVQIYRGEIEVMPIRENVNIL